MDQRPPILERSLLIPLFIGVGSLLGLCLILALVLLRGQAAETVPTQTSTPFKFILLATLTDTPSLVKETSTPVRNFFTFEETAEGGGALTPAPDVQTDPAGTPGDDVFTPTATITIDPIFSQSAPLAAGIYDADNERIIQVGNWINQQDVVDAYQNTLLVSNTTGNYAAFSFIGRQMVLGYQSNESGGDMTVNLDGMELDLNLSVGNTWFSEELSPGTHFVILTHGNGTTVNLDYIEILD